MDLITTHASGFRLNETIQNQKYTFGFDRIVRDNEFAKEEEEKNVNNSCKHVSFFVLRVISPSDSCNVH